ncbi:MAG: hypothetical protein P4L53_10960 [Candidatus Obscuribacterales bacterium]|nr:hypothetical protein [Candidatus Obscuribacterales bacterium]
MLTDAEVALYIDNQIELMNLPKLPDEVYWLIFWYSQGNLRALQFICDDVEAPKDQ